LPLTKLYYKHNVKDEVEGTFLRTRRYACKVLSGKPEGKRLLKIP